MGISHKMTSEWAPEVSEEMGLVLQILEKEPSRQRKPQVQRPGGGNGIAMFNGELRKQDEPSDVWTVAREEARGSKMVGMQAMWF